MSPTVQETAAKPRKWVRVLRLFVSGARMNRFEAQRQAHDFCLHTTVSGLERRGLKILRCDETITGTFGPIHCCRYWLAPESAELARRLLGDHLQAVAHA
jgi:hypothetical protein